MNDDGSALDGWVNGISKLSGSASGILGALGKRNTPAPAAAPAPSSGLSTGMIAAIVGGVVLLVVVLFSMGGSRQ